MSIYTLYATLRDFIRTPVGRYCACGFASANVEATIGAGVGDDYAAHPAVMVMTGLLVGITWPLYWPLRLRTLASDEELRREYARNNRDYCGISWRDLFFYDVIHAYPAASARPQRTYPVASAASVRLACG
jgi:hypothetical protein